MTLTARFVCLLLLATGVGVTEPPVVAAQTVLAAAPGPGADISTAIERAASGVAPAVVEIFATTYAAAQGVVPQTADLVTTQRASGKPMENARQLQ